MTGNFMRAVRRRLIFPFAVLVFLGANPAYAATPDLSLTPATLNFKYQAGAALPASQTLQIKSTGASLDFTVSIAGPQPYSACWLSVSANSGVTTASVKVYVNPTGLPSGTYSGTISINAPSAAKTLHTVDVRLDVGDPAATLTASPASLPTFAYVSGGKVPDPQPVVLMTTGAALNATIAVSGGSWLKASPSGSIALVGFPATVNVSVDPAGLAPGTYSGKVTFTSTSAANKTVTVSVTLNVSAGVPTITGVWPPGVLVNSPATVVTITGTNYFNTSVAKVGTTALGTTVLSPTAMLATLPATLLASGGNLSITITTPTAASDSAAATFAVYQPGPQIWAVTDAASYSTAAISPGEILTVYGIGLGPADLAVFPGTSPLPVALPATVPATSVTIDGADAPLLYRGGREPRRFHGGRLGSGPGSDPELQFHHRGLHRKRPFEPRRQGIDRSHLPDGLRANEPGGRRDEVGLRHGGARGGADGHDRRTGGCGAGRGGARGIGPGVASDQLHRAIHRRIGQHRAGGRLDRSGAEPGPRDHGHQVVPPEAPVYFCLAAIFFSRAAISRASTSGGIGYGSMPL
ncbi:MAG: hypothetical protein LAQ30_09670 [Acidobacteriia bacterium]|nr:hypothetical protein [Terriglobia bacterium]